MFVKLRKERWNPGVSDNDINIPYKNYVYEADSVWYTKFPVPVSGDELRKTMKERGVDIFLIPFGNPAELGEEYLLVSIIKKNGKQIRLVAPGCTLFLMNDDGKTIDSISCA